MNRTTLGIFTTIVRCALAGITPMCLVSEGSSFGQSLNPPNVLVSREFQLVDAAGRQRAILGVRNGSPGLFLLGKDDTVRLHLLLLEDDSPGLLLNDAHGVVRAKVVDLAG